MSDKTFRIRDYILVVGTIIAPMTGLRIWKVGPGELLCFIYCLITILYYPYLDYEDIFIRFWVLFLVAATVGTIVGIIKYPGETSLIGITIWVYLGIISIFVSNSLRFEKYEKLLVLLKIISYGAVLWYLFLFLYSRYVSDYFFNAPLWYGRARFTGGATNPHQVALLLCVSAVIQTALLTEKISIIKGICRGIALIGALFLLRRTYSSTALMACVVAIVIVLWYTIAVKTVYHDEYVIFTIALLTMVLLLFGRQIYITFMSWVAADTNGMGRLGIFSTFPEAFFKDPLFGLGSGSHANQGMTEFHNTYLEIIAMSGIVGGIIFTILTYRLFLVIRREPISIGIMTSLYVYGLSGFGMRRLVYWVAIAFAYAFALKTLNHSKNRDLQYRSHKYIK